MCLKTLLFHQVWTFFVFGVPYICYKEPEQVPQTITFPWLDCVLQNSDEKATQVKNRLWSVFFFSVLYDNESVGLNLRKHC